MKSDKGKGTTALVAAGPVCRACGERCLDDGLVVRCASCQAMHHGVCWAEGRGCAAEGCSSLTCNDVERTVVIAGGKAAYTYSIVATWPPVLAVCLCLATVVGLFTAPLWILMLGTLSPIPAALVAVLLALLTAKGVVVVDPATGRMRKSFEWFNRYRVSGWLTGVSFATARELELRLWPAKLYPSLLDGQLTLVGQSGARVPMPAAVPHLGADFKPKLPESAERLAVLADLPVRVVEGKPDPTAPSGCPAAVESPAWEGSCQVCGEGFASLACVVCARCRTLHHQSCWVYNKGCSTFGCGGRTALPAWPLAPTGSPSLALLTNLPAPLLDTVVQRAIGIVSGHRVDRLLLHGPSRAFYHQTVTGGLYETVKWGQAHPRFQADRVTEVRLVPLTTMTPARFVKHRAVHLVIDDGESFLVYPDHVWEGQEALDDPEAFAEKAARAIGTTVHVTTSTR